MKTSLKKLAVMIMTVAMVITSMSFSAFAAKDADITINGVESGTVTAYQIVKEDNGEWVPVKSGSLGNSTLSGTSIKIDADDLIALANNTTGLTGVEVPKSGNAHVKSGLDAGIYMVLVTGNDDGFVYNPMIVSVDYADNSSNKLTLPADYDDEAWAKKNKPTLDKKIVNPGTYGNENGDTAAAGDKVDYEVTVTIPSYSEKYKTPKFFFSDALQKGLKGYAGSLVVEEEGKSSVEYSATDAFNGASKYEEASDKSFRLDIKVNPGDPARTVKIKYSAYIDKEAYQKAFDPNTNIAKIEYTHKTDDESDYKEDTDKTRHYVFDIDGEINGLDGQNKKKTWEIVKVDENGIPEGDPIKKTEEYTDTTYEKHPLAGATFAIFKKGETTALQTIDTDGDGRMNFKGLDAGEYYIKETNAPNGYALNETAIPVVITADIDADGNLKSYTITINGKVTSTYTAEYDGTEVQTISSDEDNETFRVKNDKVGTLPSTGGMGTVIFTVAGIAIMAIAAGLFIANRKNASK